jgi:hypothetical protein
MVNNRSNPLSLFFLSSYFFYLSLIEIKKKIKDKKNKSELMLGDHSYYS